MTINLPGSKLAYVAGDPIWVSPDAGEAELEFARAAGRAGAQRGHRPRLRARRRRREARHAAEPAEDPKAPPADPDFRLKAYRAGMSLLRPIAPLILKIRERSGKEDPRRRGERLGQATIARPNGVLCWVHAASVGETNAVLPVIEALGNARPDLNFLLTTGTVTSAGLAERRLGPRAVHQYVPLDAPEYARALPRALAARPGGVHRIRDLAVAHPRNGGAQHSHRARQRAPVAPQPTSLAAQQVDGACRCSAASASCWRRTSGWRSASRRSAPATSCRSAT